MFQICLRGQREVEDAIILKRDRAGGSGANVSWCRLEVQTKLAQRKKGEGRRSETKLLI